MLLLKCLKCKQSHVSYLARHIFS